MTQAALFTREFYADPYPFYRQLRESDPVHYDAQLGWMLTRYEHIEALAHDPRLSKSAFEDSRVKGLPEEAVLAAQPVLQGFRKEMLRTDDPDHRRLRSLVSKAFTPRMIEALRPRIQRIVEELLDTGADTGRMDFIRDFAYPLPATVIMELLGIPTEDRDRLKTWTADRIAFLGSIRTDPEPVALALRARDSAEALTIYFQALVNERRLAPQDDLVSSLIAIGNADEDRLTEAELIANCTLLLSAGHETTSNLLGNGLLALLRHPDQLGLLKDNAALLPSSVEECLRYDSPVQQAPRAATVDMELAGRTIHAGDRIAPLMGAANRDPARFENPDQLDITRDPNEHLSFGFDGHFCLGAHLARVEAQVAFAVLLERFPNLSLDIDEVEWQPNPGYRGVKSLPIKLR